MKLRVLSNFASRKLVSPALAGAMLLGLASMVFAVGPPAGPPTQRLALAAIFGGNPGQVVVGMDGSQTSFWHEQGFRIGQDRFHVIFLKTRERERDSQDLATCHACDVRISAVVYQLVDGRWAQVSRSKDFARFGSWGDAPVVPAAQVLPFPEGAVAFLFDWSASGQGYTSTGKAVFRYTERQWTALGAVTTGGDNSGVTSDPRLRYSYTGEVSVVAGKREIPDLAVVATGTEDGPKGRPMPAKSVVYRFNGTEYKPLP